MNAPKNRYQLASTDFNHLQPDLTLINDIDMKNEWIKASKERVVAWGSYLMDTFKKLGVSNNKVIKECHIGRNNYNLMKKGQMITPDAYVRLMDYAVQVIRERKTKKLPLPVTEEELAKQLVLTFIG